MELSVKPMYFIQLLLSDIARVTFKTSDKVKVSNVSTALKKKYKGIGVDTQKANQSNEVKITLCSRTNLGAACGSCVTL